MSSLKVIVTLSILSAGIASMHRHAWHTLFVSVHDTGDDTGLSTCHMPHKCANNGTIPMACIASEYFQYKVGGSIQGYEPFSYKMLTVCANSQENLLK